MPKINVGINYHLQKQRLLLVYDVYTHKVVSHKK